MDRLINGVIYPNSQTQYIWLCIVTIAVIYNYVMIVARSVFVQLQHDYSLLWIVLDYSTDAIYITDMVIKAKTSKPLLAFLVLVG